MSWRLPSYLSADCCPADCNMGWKKEEPCWGRTTVVGEIYCEDDHWWIHGCEGHALMADGLGDYAPSDRPEDQGVEPVERD